MTIIELKAAVSNVPTRSAWSKGVKDYAIDLIDNIEGDDLNAQIPDIDTLETVLLNGAKDWKQYSWGGCDLIYDYDIAMKLCSPSELKATRNGERKPNAREEWLDVQARALYQAARLILNAARP